MVFPKRYLCFRCWCWWWICWILVILWHTTGPTKKLSSLLKAINIKSIVWFVGMLCPCQWGGGGLSCPTQPPQTPGVQSLRVSDKESLGEQGSVGPRLLSRREQMCGVLPDAHRCAPGLWFPPSANTVHYWTNDRTLRAPSQRWERLVLIIGIGPLLPFSLCVYRYLSYLPRVRCFSRSFGVGSILT